MNFSDELFVCKEKDLETKKQSKKELNGARIDPGRFRKVPAFTHITR